MDIIPRVFFDLFNDYDSFSGEMKCDIYENEKEYVIDVLVPGYDKNEVKIDYHKGYLTITAKHEDDDIDEEKNYIRREIYSGMIKRKFYVGNVDGDLITAKFDDSLLKVRVPKKEEEASKSIDIL